MFISSNCEEVSASLDAAIKQIELRLKNMVVGFAGDVAAAASENTPIASEWMVKNDESYVRWYKDRWLEYGIDPEAGFHKGAWQYSEQQYVTFNPDIKSAHEMTQSVEGSAKVQYALGDDFYIVGEGPAYALLEGNAGVEPISRQAPNGIMAPTLKQVEVAHSSDLKRHYDHYY